MPGNKHTVPGVTGQGINALSRDYPVLVGHRGYPLRYPENSLAGFTAALDAGATMVECDVQMTRDGRFVVLHDSSLARTSHDTGDVFDMDLESLQQVSVHEPARFGERFAPTPVPSLQQLLELLSAREGKHLLVEIKRESLERWQLSTVMPLLLEIIMPFAQQVTLISYDAEAIAYARRQVPLPVGWVLDAYDDAHRERALTLQPDLLIAGHRRVAHEQVLWQGPWRWMLYGIESLDLALQWGRRGIDYVETDDIGGLLAGISPS